MAAADARKKSPPIEESSSIDMAFERRVASRRQAWQSAPGERSAADQPSVAAPSAARISLSRVLFCHPAIAIASSRSAPPSPPSPPPSSSSLPSPSPSPLGRGGGVGGVGERCESPEHSTTSTKSSAIVVVKFCSSPTTPVSPKATRRRRATPAHVSAMRTAGAGSSPASSASRIASIVSVARRWSATGIVSVAGDESRRCTRCAMCNRSVLPREPDEEWPDDDSLDDMARAWRLVGWWAGGLVGSWAGGRQTGPVSTLCR